MTRYKLAGLLHMLTEFLGISIACYLGKANNPKPGKAGLLDTLDRKFCGIAVTSNER